MALTRIRLVDLEPAGRLGVLNPTGDRVSSRGERLGEPLLGGEAVAACIPMRVDGELA